VLAGVQDQGEVRFTTLIIPKQEGTSDTVSTTHEEELYFHCEAKGLIMLGWIHTHPSQDCFMSSVDIHTHCAYQTMLPEAGVGWLLLACTPCGGVGVRMDFGLCHVGLAATKQTNAH